MLKISTIQVRDDDDFKAKSDIFFKEPGTAPISPFEPLTEEQILQKLEHTKSHAEEGMVKPWDEVVTEMRQKYEL